MDYGTPTRVSHLCVHDWITELVVPEGTSNLNTVTGFMTPVSRTKPPIQTLPTGHRTLGPPTEPKPPGSQTQTPPTGPKNPVCHVRVFDTDDPTRNLNRDTPGRVVTPNVPTRTWDSEDFVRIGNPEVPSWIVSSMSNWEVPSWWYSDVLTWIMTHSDFGHRCPQRDLQSKQSWWNYGIWSHRSYLKREVSTVGS